MPEHTLSTSQLIRAPLPRVFEFFSRAENLEAITPPFLRFRITSARPVQMRQGAVIEYALALHGVPFRWRTEITAWEPDLVNAGRARFVDEQIRGPYTRWIHEHTFERVAAPDGSDATLVRDDIRYALPLSWLLHSRFVRPRLDRIFAYRAEATARLLNPTASHKGESERRNRG